MPRSRTIRPGFFANEHLAECSTEARLMFAGLWTIADREGRLEDRPKKIKGTLFPFDTFEAEPLIAELADKGFVVRYEADGQRCIWIPTFLKHQHPHPNEVQSTLPAPGQLQAIASNDSDPCASGQNPAGSSCTSTCTSTEPTVPNRVDGNASDGMPSNGSAEPQFPAELDTPAFKAAWSEWLAYRRERRVKTTLRTVKMQLGMLARWGPEAAIESIEESIRQGWQGLFDPKEKRNGKSTPVGPGQRYSPGTAKAKF